MYMVLPWPFVYFLNCALHFQFRKHNIVRQVRKYEKKIFLHCLFLRSLSALNFFFTSKRCSQRRKNARCPEKRSEILFFACSWKCWKKCLLFLAELSVEEMSGTRHDEVYGFHRHAYHFIVLQFVLFFYVELSSFCTFMC